MWGVSIHVWSSAGIDYFRLLELEDTELGRSKYPNLMIYNSATNLSLIFLLTFVLYNKIMRRLYHYYDVTHKDYGYTLAATHSIPCLLLVYFVYRMVVPSETRKVWWFFLWRVLAAPFYSVNFCDGYIGDLLTSLVRVLVPLLYSFAYLLISCYSWFSNHIDLATATSDHWWKDTILLKSVLVPWLTLLPLWLRLVQCLRRSVECGRRWPQIGNALKYTSAILVISIGTFKPNSRNSWLWLLGFVGATLYQFTWDLTQDWGVIRVTLPSSYSNMKEAIGGISISIRENKMLGSNWVYYTVICFNLVLRFAWTLTVLGTAKGTSTYNRSDNSIKTFSAAETFWHHLGPCIAAAEILRRMVWGFFRLEWEHLEKFGMLSTYDPINNSAKKDSDVELSYSNIYREEDVNFEKVNSLYLTL